VDGGVGLATWIRTTTAKLRRRYLYRINGSILSGLATVWIKKESKEKSVLRAFLLNSRFFFQKYSINTDIHTRMSTHLYEHTYAHYTSMNTSKILSWFDFEIHKVGHQERLTVDRDITSH
jgi:hypothetical protein